MVKIGKTEEEMLKKLYGFSTCSHCGSDVGEIIVSLIGFIPNIGMTSATFCGFSCLAEHIKEKEKILKVHNRK